VQLFPSTLCCLQCFRCLQVQGTDYNTADGTCVRDYIHVTDLIDAHVKALKAAKSGKPGIYNVATGKGEFLAYF
jgi:UDP-arabinose 4-epimerase